MMFRVGYVSLFLCKYIYMIHIYIYYINLFIHLFIYIYRYIILYEELFTMCYFLGA